MTRERLHSALHLLDEARRLLGASVIHVQAFDVGPDEIATMVADGGHVKDQGDLVHVELQRPRVEVDVWSRPRRPATPPPATLEGFVAECASDCIEGD